MGAHRGRRAGASALSVIAAAVLGLAPGAAAQTPASHVVAGGLAVPADLAWGADGQLYATDHLAAAVSAVSLGTAAAPGTAAAAFTGGLRSPGAIAFDQSGALWVADDAAQGDGVLMRVPADAAGHLLPGQATTVARFTDAAGTSLRPAALAIDSQGNLFVGMTRNGEIARVTTVGAPVVQRDFAHTSSDSGALGLALDGRGLLLVSEDTNITAVDLAPGPSPKPTSPYLTTPVGPVGLSAPTDLVVTPDNLFVMDTNRVVQVPMAGGRPIPSLAGIRMNLTGTGGGLVADQIGRPRPVLPGIPNPALFAGSDPGNGDTATGTVVVSDAPLTAGGLPLPPPFPAVPAPAPGATGAGAARRVLAIQVLPRGTRAPTFPRLRRSGLLFHPGAGRVFSVTFRVARTARLTFTIRTRRGALVRRFRAGARRRGTVMRFNWDGRDRRGRLVRAGLYRFTITATARRYHRTARGTVRVIRAL
jgi:sugar lactone lactonase YvrE